MKRVLLTALLVFGLACNAFALTPTSIKTSDYQCSTGECVLVGPTGASIQIFAPSGTPANGAEFEVMLVSPGMISVKPYPNGLQDMWGHLNSVPWHYEYMWNAGDCLRFQWQTSMNAWVLVADSRASVWNTVPTVTHDTHYSIRPNEFLVLRTTVNTCTVGIEAADPSWVPGDCFVVKLENRSVGNAILQFGTIGTSKISTSAGDVVDSITLNSDGDCIVAKYRGDDGGYSWWELTTDYR